jgi:hypothetical protein
VNEVDTTIEEKALLTVIQKSPGSLTFTYGVGIARAI